MELLSESCKSDIETEEKMKKNILAVVMIFTVLCCCMQANAAFFDKAAVENHISSGDINISLKEYEIRNGKEILYTNPKSIMPGDYISKIPRICNYAQPCWIRVKLNFSNSEKSLEGLHENLLQNIGKNWKKSGGYYYYTKKLKNRESVDLFTGIQIPSDWTQEHSGQKLGIEIQAEAIQADNFQPDFQAMSPWKNQIIEKCIHETDGEVTCKKENIKLRVEFNGIAHKLLAVPEDFFVNFSKAMPGDILNDQITVSNTTKKEAEIYFQTALVNQNEEQLDFLEQLQLTIHMKDKTLYDGNLKATVLKNGISLGKFTPGQQETLSFSISVPNSLNNPYALRNASVKWIFTVKEEEDDAASSDTNTTQNNANTSAYTDNSMKGEQTSSVKTGDESPLGILMFYIVLSGIVFAVSLQLRKGGTKK